MVIEKLCTEYPSFQDRIQAIKKRNQNFPWYPYDSFANFPIMNAHFKGAGRDAFENLDSKFKIADIGAGDGDTSFFFESLGANVTIIDNPGTNANDCRGILELRAALSSKTNIQFLDLDWTSHIDGAFDLTVFLGILYHLRNPMLVLNTLAIASEHLLLSTIVIEERHGLDIANTDFAELLPCRSINNDPTNYWRFTRQSLSLVLKRSGWNMLDEFIIPDESCEGQSRMFCYCKRTPAWKNLRSHHDF